MVQYPDEVRQSVITTLSMYNPKFRKERVESVAPEKDDIAIRKYYRPVIEKTDYTMEPKIYVGTAEGMDDLSRI